MEHAASDGYWVAEEHATLMEQIKMLGGHQDGSFMVRNQHLVIGLVPLDVLSNQACFELLQLFGTNTMTGRIQHGNN